MSDLPSTSLLDGDVATGARFSRPGNSLLAILVVLASLIDYPDPGSLLLLLDGPGGLLEPFPGRGHDLLELLLQPGLPEGVRVPVDSVVLVAGQVLVPCDAVVEAGPVPALDAGHDGMLVARLVDLAGAAVVEAPDEVVNLVQGSAE